MKTLQKAISLLTINHPPEVCAFLCSGISKEYVSAWVDLLREKTGQEVTWKKVWYKKYVVHSTSSEIEKIRDIARRFSYLLWGAADPSKSAAIIFMDKGLKLL